MKSFYPIAFLMIVLLWNFFLGPSIFAQSPNDVIDFGPKESLNIVSNEKIHTFTVEIADTPAETNHGLMFRDEIGPDEGMLFEFGEARIASIWMKNTSVFLDILFVRSDGGYSKLNIPPSLTLFAV